MKLFGTTTSPFVRRVRVVAAELDAPVEFVRAAADSELLRSVTPIWKVPVAVVDDLTIFDSSSIIGWLLERHGHGPLRRPVERLREQNLLHAIDAALESGVQRFYLRREGLDVDRLDFGRRQDGRIASIFGWLEGQLAPGGASFETGVGLPEIFLGCALEWMRFRETYPPEKMSAFEPLLDALRERPSFASTRPHE